MTENYFDGPVAKTYDEWAADTFAPEVVEPAVDFLAGLAEGGPVLELGVGTGRLALPLSRTGLEVHGIELSPEMVAELKAKDGSDAVEVAIGDFSTTKVDGRFSLAYLVRNTIANLTTQQAQVDCFCNVADHLEPGGNFVIELYIPELRRLPPGERFHVFDMTAGHIGIEEYDTATQIAYSHHYWISGDKVQVFSAPFRYVWPAELDLMARIAGLTLRQRWADWDRSPFTSESRSHISVWQKPAR